MRNPENAYLASAITDGEGCFAFGMLAPGRYSVTTLAQGMADSTQSGWELDVGGSRSCNYGCVRGDRLRTSLWSPRRAVIDPDSGKVSQVIDERAIADLPFIFRRYTGPGAAFTRSNTGPARGDLRVEWQTVLRRDARLV